MPEPHIRLRQKRLAACLCSICDTILRSVSEGGSHPQNKHQRKVIETGSAQSTKKKKKRRRQQRCKTCGHNSLFGGGSYLCKRAQEESFLPALQFEAKSLARLS